MNLSLEQRKRWDQEGFVHLKHFFEDRQKLREWTSDLLEWPETSGKWTKYFESDQADLSSSMLCRVENFLDYHQGWEGIATDARLLRILEQLFREPAVIFKEKLNFKLASGRGFAAHQDAPAFATFGQRFHITAMISVDPTTEYNGCLEIAARRHLEGIMEMTEAQLLTEAVIEALEWKSIETQSGDLVLFGSHLPHRSAANQSLGPRRVAFLTYNALSQGAYRQAYYAKKREVFPPENERIEGRDYGNAQSYNIGNPILS
jgi:2-aminoethylphosphonate dioxygenase